MIEVLPHAFVWVVSPVFILGTAIYAALRAEFFLGALAALGAWMVCAWAANRMFDGHLLVYGLIYGFLLAIPAMLALIAIASGARHLFTFSSTYFRKELGTHAETAE